MKFTPRTNADGLLIDKEFIYVYPYVKFKYPLPNCTSYAYSRVMQQFISIGKDWNIISSDFNPFWWNKKGSKFGNAETWFDDENNVWQKGINAKLGAIACFKGNMGHVAIVEKIYDDGCVDLSESNYGGSLFRYIKHVRLDVNSKNNYAKKTFQGYIYTPIDYSDKQTTHEELINELANRTINGEFGNGKQRKNVLSCLYTEVQNKVNEILKGGN